MALPPTVQTPALLNLAWWLLSPTESLLSTWRRMGDTYRINLVVTGDQIVVTRPDTIRRVLTDDDCFAGGTANAMLGPLVGSRSILLLDGREHARARKLLMPPFHGERMKNYTAAMRDATMREMVSWDDGREMKLFPALQRITLAVILECVLGLRAGDESSAIAAQIARVLETAQSSTGALWLLPSMHISLGGVTPWARFCKERDRLDALLFQHIARHRHLAPGERRGDILELLLDARDEDGQGLDDGELRDQLITLLLAGHETSATTAAWVIEEVLRSDGERDRLEREIASVTGGGPIEAPHVHRLERFDAAVRETLRLHPVTGVLARRATRDTTLEGYDVPNGTPVIPCIYLTHRRPDIYPEPERFLPERFIGSRPEPYAWLPFGGGSRRCLGMAFALWEIPVVLATMMSHFRLELASPARLKTSLRSFLYAPKGGTTVRLERARAA
jgi:cytochrome P450